jgi:hypothetical protein
MKVSISTLITVKNVTLKKYIRHNNISQDKKCNIQHNETILSFVMLNGIMLNVTVLAVIMVSVVAPFFETYEGWILLLALPENDRNKLTKSPREYKLFGAYFPL